MAQGRRSIHDQYLVSLVRNVQMASGANATTVARNIRRDASRHAVLHDAELFRWADFCDHTNEIAAIVTRMGPVADLPQQITLLKRRALDQVGKIQVLLSGQVNEDGGAQHHIAASLPTAPIRRTGS